MVFESWITPEETPALAAEATALIDAKLSRLCESERTAFWASIRKCYNTPYNPPAPAHIAIVVADVDCALPEVALSEHAQPEVELPIAAMAAAVAADMHAA